MGTVAGDEAVGAMTGEVTDGRTTRADTGPDRTTMVVGGGVAAVLLAIIGAAGGWVLAGDDQRQPETPVLAEGSRSPRAPAPSSPRERPASTSAPTSAAAPSPTGLTVPDLVGMDLEEARNEVRKRGLEWKFVFGTGDNQSVRSTDPVAGTPVEHGSTISITVAGAAPSNEMPQLVGEDCRKAAAELFDNGFSPRYPAGLTGKVTDQEPAAGTVGRWDDVAYIFCAIRSSDDEFLGQ
ncbi:MULTISPECIES: PASTA domain-containing protein [Micromonospora]|uniref:PASTA domain-containing protein n=1 Tax=Micromonospora TaxID=1873 RepID=UPI000C88A3F0|nr:PASTA domain-containing protein [Verrucosispora sp. ts21]PMR61052.1 penicillin-binding protein [Verrucosispora sp. ts21]